MLDHRQPHAAKHGRSATVSQDVDYPIVAEELSPYERQHRREALVDRLIGLLTLSAMLILAVAVALLLFP